MPKITLYLPQELNDEIQAEAKRLERSVSFVLQQAWLIAKDQIAEFPTPRKADDVDE